MDSKNKKIFMPDVTDDVTYVKTRNEEYLLLLCDDGNSLKVSKVSDDTLKIKKSDGLGFSKSSLLSNVDIISVESISLGKLKDPYNLEEIIDRLLDTIVLQIFFLETKYHTIPVQI